MPTFFATRAQRALCMFAICATFGATFGATAASAQSREVVFVHGLNQTGAAWNSTIPPLATELNINTLAPSLGSYSTYQVQADNLHVALGARANVIAVTHSNGGVVTRRYLTAHAAPRVTAHVSMGSPHRGSVLAQYVSTGQFSNYLMNSAVAFIEPFAFYWEHDWFDAQGLFGTMAAAVNNLADFMYNFDIFVSGFGYISPYVANVPDVLFQMSPTSSVILAQNSAASQALEAVRAPTRLGLSTQLANNHQPFSLKYSNHNEWMNVYVALHALTLAMYDHYRNHPDPYLAAWAPLWLNSANTLWNLQADWFTMQGTLVSRNNLNQMVIVKNDGIVSWESSAYPGGSHTGLDADNWGSISHLEQQTSTAVRAHVRSFLLGQGVVLRNPPPPPPPPPPPTVSVTGAGMAQPWASCMYIAGTNAGDGPFTFEWYVDAQFVGFGESMYVTIPEGGTFISVVARGPNGIVATGGTSVSSSPEAMPCYAM